MGKKAMKMTVVHDKVTDVGFIDIAEAPKDASIRVVDVTEELGLKNQVMARIDVTNDVFLGIMVEDYPAFRRELHRKYVALKIEEIITLILSRLNATLSGQHQDHQQHFAIC
jgi:hypothetical protein